MQDALKLRAEEFFELQIEEAAEKAALDGLTVVEEMKAEINALKSMPYSEYLKTLHWQELREIKTEQALGRCQLCNSSKPPLDVHHRTYERRGCECLEDLTVLCRNCHTTFHKSMRRAANEVV